MNNRTKRVMVRLHELEYSRFMQCLSFNDAWDASRALRQAVALYCEHVEAERQKRKEADVAAEKKFAANMKRAKKPHTRAPITAS